MLEAAAASFFAEKMVPVTESVKYSSRYSL
jgi:hypothetical protein